MNSVIYKYVLLGGLTRLDLPEGSRPLSVGVQNDSLVIWVLQPTEYSRSENWAFRAVNTGPQFNLPGAQYVGTAVARAADPLGFPNGIVWHVFARRQ
jgi:hypothetical protein